MLPRGWLAILLFGERLDLGFNSEKISRRFYIGVQGFVTTKE